MPQLEASEGSSVDHSDFLSSEHSVTWETLSRHSVLRLERVRGPEGIAGATARWGQE